MGTGRTNKTLILNNLKYEMKSYFASSIPTLAWGWNSSLEVETFLSSATVN